MNEIWKVQKAIKFATKTHEIYQKQKRKGKDVSYIVHPLTVGIILSGIGVDSDLVCAGILHDTIEDSIPEKKVTFEMLENRFGRRVAQTVLDVSETDKSLSWEERKQEALEHIKGFSHDSLLVKSADIISNLTELLDDYKKEGEQIFLRFNAPKDKKIRHSLETITAIIDRWPDSPLVQNLRSLADELQMIGAKEFMSESPAKIVEYAEQKETDELVCPVCGWKGRQDEGSKEYYDVLMDISCPNCDKMLLVINYPSVKKKEG